MTQTLRRLKRFGVEPGDRIVYKPEVASREDGTRFHSPSTTTTAQGEIGPDKGGSRLERSLTGRVGHDQESGLGLAWRPTGPGVIPTGSTPAPVHVGGGGVSPAGSSMASVDLSLVFYNNHYSLGNHITIIIT